MNILFVCSRNRWRSLTAETVFKEDKKLTVKSAGTEPSARVVVTSKLIKWADIIFVMEKRHKQRLSERFQEEVRSKNIVILEITDDYEYMDPELIDMIKASVSFYLNNVKE